MTIQHSLLTGTDLHEPKGVSSATSGQVYEATGTGTGAWVDNVPDADSITDAMIQANAITASKLAYSRGNCYYYDAVTGHTIAYSASAVKADPTTIASGYASDVTEGTNARLTYTGTPTAIGGARAYIALEQSTGSNKNIEIQMTKNGVLIPGGQTVATTVSGEIHSMYVEANVQLTTNDYVEVWIKNLGGSGDTVVHSLNLTTTVIG